jgi:hypothetical protein
MSALLLLLIVVLCLASGAVGWIACSIHHENYGDDTE